MSEQLYKNYLPKIILFIVGFFMTIEFFFEVPSNITATATELKNVAMVIAAFALGIGGVNILLVHGRRITNRVKGQWYYSAWLILLFLTYLIVGLILDTTSGGGVVFPK